MGSTQLVMALFRATREVKRRILLNQSQTQAALPVWWRQAGYMQQGGLARWDHVMMCGMPHSLWLIHFLYVKIKTVLKWYDIDLCFIINVNQYKTVSLVQSSQIFMVYSIGKHVVSMAEWLRRCSAVKPATYGLIKLCLQLKLLEYIETFRR